MNSSTVFISEIFSLSLFISFFYILKKKGKNISERNRVQLVDEFMNSIYFRDIFLFLLITCFFLKESKKNLKKNDLVI